MNLSDQINTWLTNNDFGVIRSKRPTHGGSICQSYLIETSSNATFFLKTLPDAPHQLFATEASGLQAIADTHTIATPQVYQYTDTYLLLEQLPERERDPNYWSTLGEQLAQLHQQPAPYFGFSTDNFCGATPQPNPRYEDGHAFFAEQRLHYQGQLALDHHLISPLDFKHLEQLCEKLTQLIPKQPISLLHGDLWSGNTFQTKMGAPALIDPACYWGWAEAELGMTQLFGGFPSLFYDSYTQNFPLAPGWQNRLALYNLYHLLNHLNLFGSNYYSQFNQILKRYL